MSTLSQFFPTGAGAGEENTSGFRLFNTTGSYTLPAGVCEVAYAVIGGGSGRVGFCQPGAATYYIGGGGGGFAFKEGLLSCGSTFTVCAVVAAPTACAGSGACIYGGTSCLSGFSTGTICATGAKSCITACNPQSGQCCAVGCGIGGDINTCGGHGGCARSNSGCGGGGGAGGIFGNGGQGGNNSSSCCPGNAPLGGGGGYGSGGGGGGAEYLCPIGNTFGCGGSGGAGLGADGKNTGGSSWSGGAGGTCSSGPTSGFYVSYTDSGKYSQSKTFLAASGGGGWGGSCLGNSGAFAGHGGASGGGAGVGGSGGFGGGGSGQSDSCGGIGGGSGHCGTRGGCGFAIIEWWT